MPTSVLHISNDYLGSQVYKNLYGCLDAENVEQVIFVPLRQHTKKAATAPAQEFRIPGSRIVYSAPLKKRHRLLFRQKIGFLYKSLESAVDMQNIDIVHATTLFSDGALALRIWLTHRKPYIVSIRNTDIYTFLKYRPDLVFLAHKILSNAQKIVFISQAHKKAFLDHLLIAPKKSAYLEKTQVIYNGIEKFWIDNLYHGASQTGESILYVGRFDANKNVLSLINAAARLRDTRKSLKLSLVGGGGNRHDAILKAMKGKGWIHYYGPVYDKERLRDIFRQHNIFAMASFHETFGLVYIEALSQGLPVVYTQGQGIDGIFGPGAGESVSPHSVADIQRGIEAILQDPGRYPVAEIDFSEFDWRLISKKYAELYRSVIR